MLDEAQSFSRVSKLWIDRDRISEDDALRRRRDWTITLVCGRDAGASYTLQLAILTAANIGNRCFPGAMRVAIDPAVSALPLKIWPSLNVTIGEALAPFAKMVPSVARETGQAILFGDVPDAKDSLRVTFDGWVAKVGPAGEVLRLQEREYCPLVGVLLAALAISELFLSFADVTLAASHRTVGLSLWQPEAALDNPSALGQPIQYLPKELWALGLGHLGNAYLWSLATLPFADPRDVKFFLGDFDTVVSANVETGLLFDETSCNRLKSRVCAEWLENRGYQTRLIERRFDSDFRRQNDEPSLALCGFDSNSARRDMAAAKFARLIDSGLGDTAENFDTIGFHTLPNPRPPEELWPVLNSEELDVRRKEQERLVREHPVYAGLAYDECGKVDLAGKSVAVPFVGAAAAALVIAEVLRVLHGGPAYTDAKWRLAAPNLLAANCRGQYSNSDVAPLRSVGVARW